MQTRFKVIKYTQFELKKETAASIFFYGIALGVGVQLAETNILQKPVAQRIASNQTN